MKEVLEPLPMIQRFLERASRILGWVIFSFGLVCVGLGAAIWWTAGMQDLGGVMGGVFLFAGLWIAIESFPAVFTRRR
jgi:hypothetical protein